MEYELLFFTPAANEGKIDLIKKEITDILKDPGGKISGDFSDIGKRKLAYPIKRDTHAFYSFVRFVLEDESRNSIPEIGKRLSLNDNITRHLIVRAAEIGRPIVSQEIKFEEEKIEKKPREKRAEKKPEPDRTAGGGEKPTDKKPKAALSELDKKLSEILEETPE